MRLRTLMQWSYLPQSSILEMKRTPGRTSACASGQTARAVVVAVACAAAFAATAVGQTLGASPTQLTPPTPMTTPSLPSASVLQAPSPLLGSVPSAAPTPGTLSLTIRDAIDRGLQYNLGLSFSTASTETARAARLRALSDLLPNFSFRGGETLQRVNLSVFGIPLPPGTPPVVGPFSIFDARALASDNLLDLHLLNTLRARSEQVKAAEFDYRNTRDLVVLAVGGAYLEVLTDAARVQAAQAEVKTGEALYKQAQDMQGAGVVPGIDVLRAQVEYQIEQQRLVSAQNDLDKHKLGLARIIGLQPSQQFALADNVPYSPAPPLALDDAIARALKDRPDYNSAQRMLSAAELAKKAAEQERLPSLVFNGDFGALGRTPASSANTYTATAAVKIPIFQGGKVRGDVEEADALLRRRQAEVSDLRARIETDVRTAFLDLNSTSQQVQVAKSSMDLAEQTLKQAQDRFAAGVTTNLEVIQAQEAIASTNENFIATLFAFNFAKLSLARSLGVAEDAVKRYLGGTP